MTQAGLVFDCGCALGEGPLWHPGRGELFWFDIENCTLYGAALDASAPRRWRFADAVSVAAILDDDRLVIAGAQGLFVFDIETGAQTFLAPLDAVRPGHRTNDGRVHPRGTLWISTMDRAAATGAGAIHAFRGGRTELLFDGLDIPNAICFSPDGTRAYFADTPTGHILCCPVSPQTGLPTGESMLFADTSALPGSPDGAVVDAAGYLWNARYGGASVVRFTPQGEVDRIIAVPTDAVTCPALAGPGLDLLMITTAEGGKAASPAGGVFAAPTDVRGQREPVITL